MINFTIKPDTDFSLTAAAGFGFGYNSNKTDIEPNTMRLAFVLDGYKEQIGVYLEQKADGTIEAQAQGTTDKQTVESQVNRILSLDQDGKKWLAVGKKDPIIGKLQKEFKGLRPVLFSSPYEGAVWSIISHRRFRGQAAKTWQLMAEEYGKNFTLVGKKLSAIPLPEQLLKIKSLPSIEPQRLERLHSVAQAALEGKLEAGVLKAMDPDEAMEILMELPGIGHFYAGLILIRSSGVTDILPMSEPRLLSYATIYYNLSKPADNKKLEEVAENWRPFRTWAVVLIRVSGDRAKLPFKK